jgi:hypothetical protein
MNNKEWDLLVLDGELLDSDLAMGDLFADPEYLAYRDFNTAAAMELCAEELPQRD